MGSRKGRMYTHLTPTLVDREAISDRSSAQTKSFEAECKRKYANKITIANANEAIDSNKQT